MKSNTDEVYIPVPPIRYELPEWYGNLFKQIKELVANERRRVMWEANRRMSMMYYHIGKIILNQSEQKGWGARIVDRLSADLKAAYPEMSGFSPRNLKYMQRFAKLWPDEEIVQRYVAQLPWRHNICLMEKTDKPNRRLIYAMAAIKNGWSKAMLELNLENFTLEREGKLPTNFDKILPDSQSDMVRQMFKDPYLLDFTGADRNSREKEIDLLISISIREIVVEDLFLVFVKGIKFFIEVYESNDFTFLIDNLRLEKDAGHSTREDFFKDILCVCVLTAVS